jgi:hypothetical protein
MRVIINSEQTVIWKETQIVVVEWITLLLCIREVPSLAGLGLETTYPD